MDAHAERYIHSRPPPVQTSDADTLLDRPLLPPIKAMDSEQYRREEHEYAARLPPSTTLVAPSLSAAYPVGPPPPYSAAPLSSGLHSQEKGLLPSLHEALGVERRGPYQPEPVSSRPPTSPRPHAIETSPRHPQVYAPTPTALAHAHHQPPSSRRPSDSYEQRRHDWPEQHSVASSSSYRQRTPPSTLSQGPRPPYSAVDLKRPYEASPNRAPVSRPTSTFPYGYSTTNSSYAPPPSTAPSHYPSVSETSHAWRPSSHAGHLPITSAPPAAIAAPTPQQTVPAPQPYGESVKRHLDLYDLEMSLNDIRENSTIALDFAKSYGARMHQVQRSGIEPGVLPAITEVDALLKGTQQTSEALSKMREVLIAQHEMHRQQVQEQARRNEDVKRSDSIHQQQEESKSGGFAGAEPKKRRGRNAAPGRCHSCNRAETPEWRRGPDGARTLCNACGLHYAKLTRKAGANKTTAGGSSLRPKDESNES